MPRTIAAAAKDFFYQRGRGTGAGSSSDQQARLVLRFGGLLDLEVLRRAVRAVVDHDPILRARFVEPRPFEGRWELRDDGGAVPRCELDESEDGEAAARAFLSDLEIRPEGPYVRILVARSSGRDTLCVRVDHRLCDGAGAKELVHRLADRYRRIAAGAPLPAALPDFTPRTVAGLSGREPPPLADVPPPILRPLTYALPRTGFANEQPAHAVRTIDAETVASVRKRGKGCGATLTDALLTALVHALEPHCTASAGDLLTLMVTSDLRARLPPERRAVLANLFQGEFPELRAEPARPFGDALAATARAMARVRETFTLEAALRGEVAFLHSFRLWAGDPSLAPRDAPPEPTFVLLSNVGVLEAERLEPGAAPLLDAQLLGTVAIGRELLVCASSFRGALTLSIGFCASDLAPAVVDGLLDRTVAALRAFAA
jgi:NRPS condensation-like uncharacterized protein